LADDGKFINKVFFLGPNWEVIDVAVIDESDGDGVTDDTAIAVLGVNPNKPSTEQIKVQVRWLSDGKLVENWFFFNHKWTPLALEAVNRMGASPLLAVLANKVATGTNMVQARQLSDGMVQRETTFFNSSLVARDVAILPDLNGDGNTNDAVYLVLSTHPDTGRNKVQTRRVSDAVRYKNITIFGTKWDIQRVTGSADMSGNLWGEVGVLAEKRTDGTLAIQLKDWSDRITTAKIYP
jgi:hypothetical protein